MASLAVILQDGQYVFVKRRRSWRCRFLKGSAAKAGRQRDHTEQRDNPGTHPKILQADGFYFVFPRAPSL